MIKDEIKDMAQKVIHDAPNMTETTMKTGLGFGGAFAAMSINDIAGLTVAILTAIYMIFQIESAWARRKKRKEAEKNEIPKP